MKRVVFFLCLGYLGTLFSALQKPPYFYMDPYSMNEEFRDEFLESIIFKGYQGDKKDLVGFCRERLSTLAGEKGVVLEIHMQHIAFVLKLLSDEKKKEVLNEVNAAGATLLFQAIILQKEKVVEFLIDMGIDVNIQEAIHGNTALHLIYLKNTLFSSGLMEKIEQKTDKVLKNKENKTVQDLRGAVFGYCSLGFEYEYKLCFGDFEHI